MLLSELSEAGTRMKLCEQAICLTLDAIVEDDHTDRDACRDHLLTDELDDIVAVADELRIADGTSLSTLDEGDLLSTEAQLIELSTGEVALGEELAGGSEATEYRLDVSGICIAKLSDSLLLLSSSVLVVFLRRSDLQADVAHLGERVLHLVEVLVLVVVLLHLAIAGLSSLVCDLSSRGAHESDATAFLTDGELTVYIVDLIGTSEQRRELLLETLRLDLLLELLELALSLQELATLLSRSCLDLLIRKLLDDLVDLLLICRAEELCSQWRGSDPLTHEEGIEFVVRYAEADL